MLVTINIHPDMIGSPKDIGDFVINQVIAEAEGKRYDPRECKNLFQDLMSLTSNKDLFLMKLCRG